MARSVTCTAYGPTPSRRLRTIVAEVKRDDPMAPVTVLVPNNIAGIVARRFLANGLGHDRRGIAAIRFTTLRHLAEQLGGPTLAGAGRRPATSALTAAAVRACLEADAGVFGPVAGHPATARALARSHRALRDVDAQTLPHLVHVSSLAADVVRLHQATRDRLIDGFYDTTDLLHTATHLLRSGAASTDELGDLVLYLPQDLDRAETGMLRALADSAASLHVVAALTGAGRADTAVRDAVAAAGQDIPPDASPASEPTAHRVLTASDADDEVRCVVREVVAALREHPAHRLAVLYSNASPYARLLHEHLAAAGITVNGAGVRPVAERATARFLLGLLETARTGFRRADVMRTLGEVPLTTFSGERVSVARFERVSREAGVVAGDDWQTKLEVYVERQGREATTAEYESRRARAERERQAGEQLLTFVTALQRRLDDAGRATTWHELGRWGLDLLDDLLTEDRRQRLPLEEQYALGVVERVLSGLAALDTQGLGAVPAWARGDSRRRARVGPPPGRPLRRGCAGRSSVAGRGARPRRGLGAWGSPRTSTPAGSTTTPCCLKGCGTLHPASSPSTRARLDSRHRQLLAAFETASRVTASFPRGDLRRSSERLPSRWLLPSLRRLSGNPDLAATKWAQGVDASEGWLHSSPSFAASVLSTDEPSTHQEWAMRAASATRDTDDAVVAAARELQRGRRSEEFTRFDGNLTGSEALPDFATGERLLSPTSLERYAICPHAWFVQRMLYVEPVESPEEAVEISALDVGNIVHESFDQLVTEATERGELPGYGQPWTQTATAEAERDRRSDGRPLRGRGQDRPSAAVADRAAPHPRHPRLDGRRRQRLARPTRRPSCRQRAALRHARHRSGHRRPAGWRFGRVPRLCRQGRPGPRRHHPGHRHQDRQLAHVQGAQG